VYTVAPAGEELERDTCDDLDLDPILSVAWSGGLRLVAGVGRDEPGFPAYAALWDAERGELLPGTFPIGRGAVTRAIDDGAGGAFLLLGWSGELLHLAPR
jgi:hypothetical protein